MRLARSPLGKIRSPRVASDLPSAMYYAARGYRRVQFHARAKRRARPARATSSKSDCRDSEVKIRSSLPVLTPQSKVTITMSERNPIAEQDPEVWKALVAEQERQANTLELIASENHVSPAVLAAAGSVM